MRKDIQLATQDLRRLGRVKKVNSFCTWVGLAVGVAETLSGIVGPGLGLAGLSAALDAQISAAEWKHKWLLFGRSLN